MQGGKAYLGFQRSANDVMDRLKDFKDSLENISIEVKYSFLKFSKSPEAFQKIQQESLKAPQILNYRKDHRLHKINAAASLIEAKNIAMNLENMRKEKPFKVQETMCLNINTDRQRFILDARDKGWSKALKQSLLERQLDIISGNQAFRLDICEKINTEENVDSEIQGLLADKVVKVNIIRLKKVVEYNISDRLLISYDHILEIKDPIRTQLIVKAVCNKEASEALIKLVRELFAKQKEEKLKYEIELHFTTKCLREMKDMSKHQLGVFLTKTYDLFRDIGLSETDSLTKMMDKFELS